MNSAMAGHNGACVEGVMQDRTVHLVAPKAISISTAYHIIQGGEMESKQLQMGLHLTLLQHYSNTASSFVPLLLAMKICSSPITWTLHIVSKDGNVPHTPQ